MKRKRLKHFGDAVIGILTGYQVILNSDYFEKYGQGEYILDLLKGHFTFNGDEKEMFPIFSNIQKWFNNEIVKNRIDINFVATAKVTLQVEKPNPGEKIRIETRSWLFFKKIVEIDMYKYKTVINFTLITDEKDYSKTGVGAIGNL